MSTKGAERVHGRLKRADWIAKPFQESQKVTMRMPSDSKTKSERGDLAKLLVWGCLEVKALSRGGRKPASHRALHPYVL
jgi:hypothetical protein